MHVYARVASGGASGRSIRGEESARVRRFQRCRFRVSHGSCRETATVYWRVIFASSSSVYGLNTKVPFSETDMTDSPASLYAATKKSDELLAHTYNAIHGVAVTALRFFTVYGPLGRPDMAYFSFANNIVKGNQSKSSPARAAQS